MVPNNRENNFKNLAASSFLFFEKDRAHSTTVNTTAAQGMQNGISEYW